MMTPKRFDVWNIRMMLRDGRTLQNIAEFFDVSRQAVHQKLNQRYKSVLRAPFVLKEWKRPSRPKREPENVATYTVYEWGLDILENHRVLRPKWGYHPNNYLNIK